jgi:hypothetical protein
MIPPNTMIAPSREHLNAEGVLPRIRATVLS